MKIWFGFQGGFGDGAFTEPETGGPSDTYTISGGE